MTISFYCPLKGDFNGRFWAMWAKIVRSDFFSNSKYKKIPFQRKKYKIIRKIKLWEKCSLSVLHYLKQQNKDIKNTYG